MAEAVLGVVTAISNKVLPLAADEISRAWRVKKELEKLSQNVEIARVLLSDVKRNQLTSSDIVELWRKKLQSVARDAEIVLDDFGYEVLRRKVENRKWDKVRNLFSSSNPVSFVRMANKIKNASSSLEDVFKEASRIGLRPVELIMKSPDHSHIEDRLTDPFVDESEIVGREDDVSNVVSMLISSDYKKDLPVISIVGMAGQGKTALAQTVRKNDIVVEYFDKIIWVCVSDDFKVERLLNEMLQSLGGMKVETPNRELLVRKLQENLKGKRYLLVLDDVWNETREKWECMRTCLLEISGAQGSKILGTTRSDYVASAMLTSNYHPLGVLSTDYSWMLFEKLAFADGGARKTQDLVDIGRRILKRCGGVPLAIRAVGGLLYSMKDQSEWLMIEKSEKWNKTSSIADRVFSALKLSYEHLPSSLKPCFASCSIFPKDTVIEKEDLIQIWMAQGLISHPKGGHLQMEDIGSNYFNILLRSSLLQNPEKDRYNNIISCKMHDLVHDFSLEVSNNYIFDTDDGMVINKDADFVHLTLISREGKMLKNMEGIPPTLRTLYLIDGVVVEDFLKRFRYLCVLKLKCVKLKNLPNAVGEMKHLRDLDISKTSIRTLPDSITKLYNLMTLRVNQLKRIPKGFGNLINLRHLYFFVFSEGCLLPGVGQLPNLQTLSVFNVSKGKGCQIEELGRLHNLKGKIEIYGLQNVSSNESAANANLSGKSNIWDLKLRWDMTEEDREDSMGVMEGLQPHSNLKSLTIMGFNGSKLPSWMGTENHLTPLQNLIEIYLVALNNCEQVPSFGVLPYLQILEMRYLPNVKCIGSEFYGLETLESARRCINDCEGTTITLFPALTRLVLHLMDSLMEWADAMIPSDSSSIKVFPNLEELILIGLPKLSVLPGLANLTCLQHLSLIDCPSLDASNLDATNLSNLCLGVDFEDLDYFPWPFSISSGFIPTNDADGIKQHFVSLEFLILSGCEKIKSLPEQIQHLSTLRSLRIQFFRGLEVLPEWLGGFQNLKYLGIEYCPNLKQLPEAMNRLTNLRQLGILGCSFLEKICTRGSGTEWPKIAHIPMIMINDKRV